MSRPRHPKKDIEALIRKMEAGGWRVKKGGTYFKAYCPCGEHKRNIHLTPSSNDYVKNTSKWLTNRTCWNDGH